MQLAADAGRVLVSADIRTMGRHFSAFIAEHHSPGIILTPSGISIGEAVRRLHGLWLSVRAEEIANQIGWLVKLESGPRRIMGGR